MRCLRPQPGATKRHGAWCGRGLLLALLLMLSPAAFAQEAQPETVTTQQELFDWLSANSETGGTVCLGDTIVITESPPIYSFQTNFVIETGPHGLVFDGGELSVPFTAVGEGVDVPVLEVVGFYMRGSLVQAVQSYRVTATGRDGEGGIALKLSMEDNGWEVSTAMLLERGSIRSSGRGAVGVELVHPLSLYCMNIAVQGEDSVAVRAPAGGELHFCEVTAEGQGAAIADGQLLLEGCLLSPEQPDNLATRITCIAGPSYLPLRQAEGGRLSIYDLYSFGTLPLLAQAEGAAPQVLQLPVELDEATVEAVDLSEPGLYRIGCRLTPAFAGLGLEPEHPLQLTVEVRDPALPCLSAFWVGELTDAQGQLQQYVMLEFWQEHAAQELTLWQSPDEGQTWVDCTDDSTIEWGDGWVRCFFGALSGPVLFQLESADGGLSNVAELNTAYGITWGDSGGDRTGVDRTNDPPEPPPDRGRREPFEPVIRISPTEAATTTQPTVAATQPDPIQPEPIQTQPTGAAGEGLALEVSLPAAAEATAAAGEAADPAAEGTAGYVHPVEVQRTQTDPAPPPTGASAPAPQPPQEYETGEAIGLLGQRMALLAETNPGGAVFVKNGLTITVTAEALAALNPADDALFELLVARNGDAESVSFLLDGQAVALPYTAQPLRAEQTDPTPPPAPLLETEAQQPVEPTRASSSAPLLLGGAAALCAAGLAILRRRRRTA